MRNKNIFSRQLPDLAPRSQAPHPDLSELSNVLGAFILPLEAIPQAVIPLAVRGYPWALEAISRLLGTIPWMIGAIP